MSKILVVDDDRLLREIERSFLDRADCEILVARRGEEALEHARTHHPEVVILDADMPGMDGAACCRALKAEKKTRAMPVILLASGADRERCEEAGADGVVSKPVRGERLLNEIRRHVAVVERAAERVAVILKVECRVIEVETTAYTMDLSTSGMFLKTRDPFSVGDLLELAFVLSAGDEPIRVSGRVVRVVGGAAHETPGIGVAFGEMTPGMKREIARFVREHVAEPV